MDGFKNSTKTQYMKGGDVSCYAKGGAVKGAAKISKVMGEFKKGELHSGSKKGPEVTSRKQATAIALSEARKAGAKIPQPVQKKSLGGVIERVAAPLIGGVLGGEVLGGGVGGALAGGLSGALLQHLLRKKESGQPMSSTEQQKLEQAQAQPTAKKTGGAVRKAAHMKTGGNPGDAVARGNRVSAEEAGESVLVRRRRRAAPVEPDYSKMKNYDAPSTPHTDTPLQQRLTRRGVPAHNAAPMINRKQGGLAVMPKGKKC